MQEPSTPCKLETVIDFYIPGSSSSYVTAEASTTLAFDLPYIQASGHRCSVNRGNAALISAVCRALPVWLALGGLHLGLGLALKLYFFRYKKASLVD